MIDNNTNYHEVGPRGWRPARGGRPGSRRRARAPRRAAPARAGGLIIVIITMMTIILIIIIIIIIIIIPARAGAGTVDRRLRRQRAQPRSRRATSGTSIERAATLRARVQTAGAGKTARPLAVGEPAAAPSGRESKVKMALTTKLGHDLVHHNKRACSCTISPCFSAVAELRGACSTWWRRARVSDRVRLSGGAFSLY